MSLVLRVREYCSADEAMKDIVSFQVPRLPLPVLLYGTVVMAEGSVNELRTLAYAARDMDAKSYAGRLGGRDALLIVLPYIDAVTGPLPEHGSSLAACINDYRYDRETDIPLPGGVLRAGRTLVMGILNVTPDSFSDGGCCPDADAAYVRAEQMVEDGADLIDVGGESTRPGAAPVGEEEELARVVPAVRRIASSFDIPISVDTMKPAVARAAMEAGASIINDITGLREEGMVNAVADTGAAAVVMHMRGGPETMHAEAPAAAHDDIVADVMRHLSERIEAAEAAGVPREKLMIDPGLGFGKTFEQNAELLRRCRELRCLGRPVLIGASRKRFIGQLSGEEEPGARLGGSIGAAVAAAMNGAAVVRVHDVKETVQALRVTDSMKSAYRM